MDSVLNMDEIMCMLRACDLDGILMGRVPKLWNIHGSS